jgi:hypothetical protein
VRWLYGFPVLDNAALRGITSPVGFTVTSVGLFARFGGVDLFACDFQKLLECIEVDAGRGQLPVKKLLRIDRTAAAANRNVGITDKRRQRLRFGR